MSNEIEKVLSLGEPLARSMGYEILKAELASEHGERIIRIYLDKPAPGVTIDDCEQFSKALSTILDVEGNLPGRYNLEISSPGLNRPLPTARHFTEQLGNIIQVHTEEEVEGRKNFKGELLRVVEEVPNPVIEMWIDGKKYQVPLSAIKKANLDYFATEEKLKKIKTENRRP